LTRRPGSQVVLAGDVGGTKTHLGLYERGEKRPRLLVSATYASRESRGLETLVAGFLEENPGPVRSACFGIPGPVLRGRSRTTNLPWTVSEAGLRKRFGWDRITLLNDLAAMAHGIPVLGKHRFSALNHARIKPSEPRALLAPGTGLGVALLLTRPEGIMVLPSEGGHVDFAPSDGDEVDLWHSLHDRYGHVSIERILSGPGIVDLYTWLHDTGRFRKTTGVQRRLSERDPASAITHDALEAGDPACMETLNRFTSILGAAAGNVVLTAMATGGVYLGGGIPPKILPFLENGPFLKSFRNKGRFRGLLEGVGIRVLLDERTALLGAARFALESFHGG
jgi:glucokinase